MRCSLEGEVQFQLDQELLAPMEESQEVVEQPLVEEHRMETTTQIETTRE